MYHFPGASSPLIAVTVNHGTIDASTTEDATASCAGALTSDNISVTPQAAPETGLVIGAAWCHTPGAITVRLGNCTTATVAAGTAVVYNTRILR